ncbi:MAG: ATP-binding protein [Actinomycetota bacterium]
MKRSDHMLEIALPPTAHAPSMARSALRHSLRLPGRLPDKAGRACDAELLVSELVANCVRHAGLPMDQAISLAMEVGEGQLRVEIADRGRGFSELTTTGIDRGGSSGWGLMLVEQLADDWGVDTGTKDGTTVWFEMQLGSGDV